MNYHTNLLQNCVLIDPESMDWENEIVSRSDHISNHLLFWWCHMQGMYNYRGHLLHP
jgi:hypothetical protein